MDGSISADGGTMEKQEQVEYNRNHTTKNECNNEQQRHKKVTPSKNGENTEVQIINKEQLELEKRVKINPNPTTMKTKPNPYNKNKNGEKVNILSIKKREERYKPSSAKKSTGNLQSTPTKTKSGHRGRNGKRGIKIPNLIMAKTVGHDSNSYTYAMVRKR